MCLSHYTSTSFTVCATPTMARLNLVERDSKKVCFNDEITIKEIPSHREWTPYERLSRYNTDDDYLQFNIAENHECFNGPPSSKVERIKRSRRIKYVRYLVIRAQYVQRKIAKNNYSKKDQDKEDHSKWLAEFYRHYSEKLTQTFLSLRRCRQSHFRGHLDQLSRFVSTRRFEQVNHLQLTVVSDGSSY